LLGWRTVSTSVSLLKSTYRAIALSLQDAAPKHAVIDLDTDDEDDEDANFQAQLNRAIMASKAETSRRSHQPAGKDVAPSDSQPTMPGASVFLSERAQLEKERRERQKRLRPEAALDGNDHGDDSDEDVAVREPPAKRQHLSSSSGVRTNNASTRPASSSSTPSTSANVPTIDRVFWDGEFRQTATKHAEPRKDGRPTFRITEVLGQVSSK
jgi:tyrosyl-DNA phosphodiesterase 1